MIDWLFGGEGYVEFTSIERPSNVIRTVHIPAGEEAALHARQTSMLIEDRYFAVCRKRLPDNPNKRSSSADVHQVICLWADIDYGDLSLTGLPIPTLVMKSGHGWHVYWRLKEPLEASGSGDMVVAILRGVAQAINGDPKCAELNRLLRVPNTMNYKHIDDPTRCVPYWDNHRNATPIDRFYRYAIADTPSAPVVSAGANPDKICAAEIASALGAVQIPGAGPSDKRWQARCPAHNDHTPSLSISEAKDGTVLLYCHAHCEFSAIVEAAGFKVAQMFADSVRKPTRAELRKMIKEAK